jgi:hypothetical protein
MHHPCDSAQHLPICKPYATPTLQTKYFDIEHGELWETKTMPIFNPRLVNAIVQSSTIGIFGESSCFNL